MSLILQTFQIQVINYQVNSFLSATKSYNQYRISMVDLNALIHNREPLAASFLQSYKTEIC